MVVFDLYSVFTKHNLGLLKQHYAAHCLFWIISGSPPSRRYDLHADWFPVINDDNYYYVLL